jgi:hypothetical protein
MEWLKSLTSPPALELGNVEPSGTDTGETLRSWAASAMFTMATDGGEKCPLAKMAVRFQPLNTAVMEVHKDKLVHRFNLGPGTFDIVRDLAGVGCKLHLWIGGRPVNRTMTLPLACLQSHKVEVEMRIPRGSTAEFGFDATVKAVPSAVRTQLLGAQVTSCGYTFADGMLVAST